MTAMVLRLVPRTPLAATYSSSIAVRDRDHRLLRLTLSDDDKYRLWTPLSDISPNLVAAMLLHEDRHFYRHFAVNPLSLLRAVYVTYIARERRVGGSTIPMQLARLHYRIKSRSLRGKLSQVLHAVYLELRYPKEELLEAYLNLVPFGQNIEGVAAASQIYFGKSVAKLQLAEALTLAVIPQSPLRRGSVVREAEGSAEIEPNSTGTQALMRARAALYEKWLTAHRSEKRDEALMKLPISLRDTRDLPFRAPHFVESVLAQARSDGAGQAIGSRRSKAAPHRNEQITTLDLSLQQLVEKQIKGYVARNRRIGITNAVALLVDSRDLSVRAAVGSADFFDAAIEGQVSGLTARRSPGSTLKPFIYALGIDQGAIHPLTMLKDAQLAFGAYSPENFDGRFAGPVSAKEALVRSRNVPALTVAAKLTNPSFYAFLKSAGISRMKSEEHYGLSLVLGGGEVTMEELATLYAMLANRGVLRPLRWRKSDPESSGIRLLSDESSFMTVEMLKDNPRPGDAETHSLRFTIEPYRAAWKTGTSYGFRDAWTAGIIGPYVLAVWIGHFNGEGNPAFVGVSAAAPLFFAIGDALYARLRDLSEPPRPLPSNVSRVPVCAVSGQIPSKFCPHKKNTWFIPGRSPIEVCQIHRPVLIDELTGKQICRSDGTSGKRRGRLEVYEFWPSDLLRLFQQAGLPRRTPPPAEGPGCDLTAQSSQGQPPTITSPLRGVVYTLTDGSSLRDNDGDRRDSIGLSAITDADASEVFWFVGGTLAGRSKTGQSFLWKLPTTPGKYVIRAVDDHGRSDTRELTVARSR
ncbi:MAG: penicillin-binding protein 1C [Myxococcales bacterium]|nr:penicillin-binding protein 1C [Myxococcales bacterium]